MKRNATCDDLIQTYADMIDDTIAMISVPGAIVGDVIHATHLALRELELAKYNNPESDEAKIYNELSRNGALKKWHDNNAMRYRPSTTIRRPGATQ